MRLQLSSLLLLCLLLPAAVIAQQTIAAGPWSAVLGDRGPSQILYNGEPLARSGALSAYLPDWKGTRFTMDGATLQVEGSTATWTREDPGNQSATLTLELGEKGCMFSLHTTIEVDGPSEFSLQLLPEAVRTDETTLFTWLEGRPSIIGLDVPFERISSITDLRFEPPDRSVQLICDGMEMQDRRAANGELFLVSVLGGTTGEPREVDKSITLQVTPVPAEDIEARGVLLSQRPEEYLPIEPKNPGFEHGEALEGWSLNPLAAVDREVKHYGEQSARLTIEHELEPESRSQVYLTQMVPVTEGRLYRTSVSIRTEDVKSGSPAGTSSTGATVIVEFADKQGKWFAGGSYAKGLYGTVDWRSLRTDPVQAPKGAGFAIIYLALRAYGTAWFDDVRFEEVRRHAVLLSPLSGTRVDDNTPRFDWYYHPGVPTALELSSTEDFSADVRRLTDVRQPPYSLDEPLAPGQWYWRLLAPEFDYASPAWRFTQTAPLDQDCTEPRILAEHGHLSRPDEPVTIRFADNVGVTKATLMVDGEEVVAELDLQAQELSFAPAEGWTPGLHSLGVEAADAAGNRAGRALFYTHTPDMPRTVWLQEKGVQTNGERKFLFGMYGIREEDMPEMAAGGFDFVHNYRWDGAGTTEEAIEYLDEAEKHGLQAFMGLSRARLMAEDEQFVAQRVAALMTHPGLLCWYLYDEPDLPFQYVSPLWMERYYKLIQALDPFHPIVVTCAYDSAVPLYKDALDVHWTQVYGNTTFVSSRLEKHRAVLNPETPLAAILHCYDRAQKTKVEDGVVSNPEDFEPSPAVLRANAFMAVAHRASCLIWWWWGQGGTTYGTVAHIPDAWAALQQAVADISSLEPVLTADGDVQTWIEEPQEGIQVHVWEKRLPGKTVIIAVNRDEQPCEATLNLKLTGGNRTAKRLFEDGTIGIAGGKLADTFQALGVHVYEVE